MTETWPAGIRYPGSFGFNLSPNTMFSESPLSRSRQTKEILGARWVVQMYWNAVNETEGILFENLKTRLSGMSGRVYMWHMKHEAPRGIGTGTPLIKTGAAINAVSIATKGWTINQTGILLEGDLIGINGQVVIVTADANSDGAGDATLAIKPPLHAAAEVNDAITVTKPTATFMLENDDAMQIIWSPGGLVLNIAVVLVEDIL